jgi:hypothetical protein
MDTGSPDGERFADEAEKPIPPKHTWDELTTSQLIDVKLQLEEKLWAFGKNPTIAKVLQQGVNQLETLIASRGIS